MKPRLHIGSVSYLNAKPLIYGLSDSPDLQLSLEVPSKLIDGLRDARFDVALLPVIDYQRMSGLQMLKSGGIGSDGPTLTVRIFSKVPVQDIKTLACDPDSHTSVALARILLAESIDLHPELIDLHRGRSNFDAQLLIGDKVVCDEPRGFPHQLDLGEGWKKLTGLPFVFAAWFARLDIDLGDLPARLEAAKNLGLQNVKKIVTEYAIPSGWPADLAMQYLTSNLQFDINARQIEAIKLFYELAAKHGIIPSPPRELKMQS